MMQVRFLSAAFKEQGVKMNIKKSRKAVSFKENIHRFDNGLKDYLTLIKEWLTDYGHIILPIILFVCVGVTLVVAIKARTRVEEAQRAAEEALIESKTEVIEVKETVFEENAYPEINALIKAYYDAIKAVDVDALEGIQGSVSDTEKLRLQAMSPYIDRYDNINVYTKPGPYIDTYIAYVTVDVYLKEAEPSIPGLESFYVCKDIDDTYYINVGELAEDEAAFIKDITEQADVVDLKNTVNVQYAELMESDEKLKNYWAQISVEIDSSVGEQLTEEAVIQARLEDERKAREEEERRNDPNYVEEEPEVIKVKVNTLVNVRKSASAEAEKMGTASVGTVYEVIEVMRNGWTKINYDGAEAYIKSEFLDQMEDIGKIPTVGNIKATDFLNVRSEPDQTAAKLGVLNSGDIVELVEEVGDWSKIKYNDQIGYVKTEYTEKQ